MKLLVILIFTAVLIGGAILLAGKLFEQRPLSRAADTWWRSFVRLSELPDERTDGARRAEITIDGRPVSVRLATGPRTPAGENPGHLVRFVASFPAIDLPFEMVDHLQSDNPVGLRSGMPRFDQQSVLRTTSPVETLRTFDYEGISGKMYRLLHLDPAWQWRENRLVLEPEFPTRDNPLTTGDIDGPDACARQLKSMLERGAQLYDQLEEARQPRDTYWRPRTDTAEAWKAFASEHDLRFACSQAPYEDAAIEGDWEGRKLVAHTAGKADRPASDTRLTLDVPDLPLDIDFTLLGAPAACTERDELLADIADGSHDLSTDDDSSGFERIFDIHGDRITTYGHLGRPGVEPALLKLYRPDIEIVVEPAVIEVRLPEVPRTESELTSLLEDVELLADALVGDVTDMDVLDETTATQDSSAADWT